MADHFVSLNRGEEGLKYSDFSTGAASTPGDVVELRVTDGALTRKDVVNILDAFERFIENAQQSATFVFLAPG